MDTITKTMPIEIEGRKIGRNEKVQITNGLQTKIVKHKKLEPLFAEGWT